MEVEIDETNEQQLHFYMLRPITLPERQALSGTMSFDAMLPGQIYAFFNYLYICYLGALWAA